VTAAIYGGTDAQQPKVNIGDMQNTGIDASATYHGSAGKDFKFDVGVTFTSYKNKIVDIPDWVTMMKGRSGITFYSANRKDNHLGLSLAMKWSGLFQSDEEVSKSPYQVDAQPGVFKYRDVDGNDSIDQNDRNFNR
jgi:hypothetical protein